MTHTITSLDLDNIGNMLFMKYVEAAEAYHLCPDIPDAVQPRHRLRIATLIAMSDLLTHVRFLDENPVYAAERGIVLSIPLPYPIEPWGRDLYKIAYESWKSLKGDTP